jgi:methyl-accepting chemotaxis protein
VVTDVSSMDTTIKERLQGLIPVFAKAAIGDFSTVLEIPETDDEITEVYMGVKIMLETIREKITEYEKVKAELEEKLAEIQKTNDLMVGREERMIELKEELAKYKALAEKNT